MDVRRVALRTLAHVATPGSALAVESAAKLLTDRAWPVRWAAIDAVAWLAQGGSRSTVSKAFEVLAVRLEDVDWPVRMAAAIALNNFLQFLTAISEMKSDGQQVGKLDDVMDQVDLVLHPLPKLLKDPAKEVKQAALELLPLVCEGSCGVQITGALRHIVEEDVSLHQRGMALRLLGRLGAGPLQNFLQDVRSKADSELLQAAEDAIEMWHGRQAEESNALSHSQWISMGPLIC